MKKILFIVTVAILYACGNIEETVEEVTEQVTEEEVEMEPETYHGEEITGEGSYTAAEFIEQFEELQGHETKLIATIDEVCAKKGCWMVLDLGNEKNMRVTFKDYEFFVPKDAAGKKAVVQGVATMDTTTIEMLQHYASDAGETQEAIDAITEPEYNYAFEAIGVIIRDGK